MPRRILIICSSVLKLPTHLSQRRQGHWQRSLLLGAFELGVRFRACATPPSHDALAPERGRNCRPEADSQGVLCAPQPAAGDCSEP